MSGMFYGDDSLTNLNIPKFNLINCQSYDNIFSNIDNIRYINLYNVKNDKIISEIFNEAKNPIFVCQSDELITNPKATYCCDYNIITNECNLEIISDEFDTSHNPITESVTSDVPVVSDKSGQSDSRVVPTSSDSDNGQNDTPYPGSSRSSSKMSIGVIIAIVGGILAVLGIITLIICCCRKKKIVTSVSQPPIVDSSNMKFDPEQEIKLVFEPEYEYEPHEKNNNNVKVKIILETTSQTKVQILIDPNKTLTELIQFYFQIIKRPDLFKDKSIRFLLNAKLISHDSSDMIKNYISKKVEINKIIIDDLDDKIKI